MKISSYLKYNAGKLEKNLYATGDNDFIFQGFYSIKHGYATLNEKLRLNYNDDWWSKKFIPFGYDGGGNLFCFSKDMGEIYYIYEDDSDDDENIPVVYLASNFLDFINNMAEEGEEYLNEENDFYGDIAKDCGKMAQSVDRSRKTGI